MQIVREQGSWYTHVCNCHVTSWPACSSYLAFVAVDVAVAVAVVVVVAVVAVVAVDVRPAPSNRGLCNQGMIDSVGHYGSDVSFEKK